MTRIPSYALCAAGLLHVLFMAGELFPWQAPFLFQRLSDGLSWSNVDEKDFVISVVHNAGIYNGIVAAGLFFAAYGTRVRAKPRTMADVAAPGMAHDATLMATVLLVGSAIAGIFGAVTLGPLVVFQAVIVLAVLLGLWMDPLLKIVAQRRPSPRARL